MKTKNKIRYDRLIVLGLILTLALVAILIDCANKKQIEALKTDNHKLQKLVLDTKKDFQEKNAYLELELLKVQSNLEKHDK